MLPVEYQRRHCEYLIKPIPYPIGELMILKKY